MNENTKRLSFLQGNTSDVSPDNTREQNSRIITQKHQERFQNRQIRERERKIKNIPKGIITKRKSSLNFSFPETPPFTPPRDDFSHYLQPPSSSTPFQDDFSRYFNHHHIFLNRKNRES